VIFSAGKRKLSGTFKFNEIHEKNISTNMLHFEKIAHLSGGKERNFGPVA
jgi:hypothetical protein